METNRDLRASFQFPDEKARRADGTNPQLLNFIYVAATHRSEHAIAQRPKTPDR
ncbi:MAG: hypothetical protein ACI9P3_001941, partial [Bradyrhizobium sp.]